MFFYYWPYENINEKLIMQYLFLLLILILFLIATILSFGIGLYLKDLFFLAIGGLLIFASILIFLKCKKIKTDPFL